MIKKLKAIKKLRKTRKLIIEEELKKLEKDYKSENRNEKIAQRMDTIKKEINRLEKDLKNLNDLENKFNQKS